MSNVRRSTIRRLVQGCSPTLCLLIALLGMLRPSPALSETVPLERYHGTYMISVQINGAVVLPFVLDTGASLVVLPADVFRTLTRTGTVTRADFVGTGTAVLADGSKHPSDKAARVKGVQLPVLKARTEDDIDTAFAALGQLQAGGLMVSPDQFLNSRFEQLAALETRYAIPTISEVRAFAAAGGLISYGVDGMALLRQVGIYAGRILKGERPADLPVQQPTTFQLVVNLKTAKALGLTVPPLILARADEVIE